MEGEQGQANMSGPTVMQSRASQSSRAPTPSPLTTPIWEADASEPTSSSPNDNNLISHQLTIRGKTFFGPLPPDRDTDPSNNAEYVPGDHSKYMLFKCDDCPISQEGADFDLHDLCYDTHPCIWSFPPKAREAYTNRRHWLQLDKPLEETRLANGKLPKMLDEDGEPVSMVAGELEEGEDPNKAHDKMVKRRYQALIKPYECCELEAAAEEDEVYKQYCEVHRSAREAMLEDMSWRFDW